jgi:hypothetical protein
LLASEVYPTEPINFTKLPKATLTLSMSFVIEVKPAFESIGWAALALILSIKPPTFSKAFSRSLGASALFNTPYINP